MKTNTKQKLDGLKRLAKAGADVEIVAGMSEDESFFVLYAFVNNKGDLTSVKLGQFDLGATPENEFKAYTELCMAYFEGRPPRKPKTVLYSPEGKPL